MSYGRAHSRVHAARQRVSPQTWGTLAMAFGPMALDDRHGGVYDAEITSLLRFTSAVQSEAAGRWAHEERVRLLACADPMDRPWLEQNLFVLPSSPGALRGLCTRIIGEGRQEVMYGDPEGLMVGALEEARTMLAEAETAWLIALRCIEREATAWR